VAAKKGVCPPTSHVPCASQMPAPPDASAWLPVLVPPEVIPHIAGSPLDYDDCEANSVEKSCDIIVIGGGVIGTAIAWALSKRRPGKIVVLEKRFLGAGSSGKSGAIVRQHYSNRLTALMAQKSLRVFERFDDVVGGPPVFTRTGMVLVVNGRDR